MAADWITIPAEWRDFPRSSFHARRVHKLLDLASDVLSSGQDREEQRLTQDVQLENWTRLADLLGASLGRTASQSLPKTVGLSKVPRGRAIERLPRAISTNDRQHLFASPVQLSSDPRTALNQYFARYLKLAEIAQRPSGMSELGTALSARIRQKTDQLIAGTLDAGSLISADRTGVVRDLLNLAELNLFRHALSTSEIMQKLVALRDPATLTERDSLNILKKLERAASETHALIVGGKVIKQPFADIASGPLEQAGVPRLPQTPSTLTQPTDRGRGRETPTR